MSASVWNPYHEWNVVVNLLTQHSWDWDPNLGMDLESKLWSQFRNCYCRSCLSTCNCAFKHFVVYVYCNLWGSLSTWLSIHGPAWNVDIVNIVYTVHQLVVHMGCWHSECCRTICHYIVLVSSALPYIHTTVCWCVNCHLTMFTVMLLMWAAHTGRTSLSCSSWLAQIHERIRFEVSCENAYHIAGKFGSYWNCQKRRLAKILLIACSTKFANFALQTTNAQGLGTRLTYQYMT